MTEEKEFDKYEKMGAYHWRDISCSLSGHNAYTAARYRVVVDIVKPAQGLRICDVGCGDAALSWRLAMETGASVIGCDTSLLGLRLGRQQLARRALETIQLVCSSAYATGLADDSVGWVVAADVIEHVDCPRKMLAEACRILRPGGRICVTTPYRLTEKPISSAHTYEFFPEELHSLMSEFFTSVEIQCMLPLFMLEMYVSPKFRWFHTLINVVSILRRRSPFLSRGPWRYNSIIVAVGQLPESSHLQ